MKRKTNFVVSLSRCLVVSSNEKTSKRVNEKTKRGFTLLEILMVCAMVAVISLAIYATFNNGVKVWQRINHAIAEEDVNIFLDRFASDLKNTFKFKGLNFQGEEDRFEFLTLVNSSTLNKRTVGKIIYLYRPDVQTINREQKDYSQIYSAEDGSRQESLKNIKFLKFQYYFYDAKTKEYFWKDEWLNEGLPLAVRIELDLDDGSQIKRFTRTVGIPVSG